MTQLSPHEDILLNQIRSQNTPGLIRRRLYEIFEFNGARIPNTSFEWMTYSAEEGVEVRTVSDDEHNGAKALLRAGHLVRTFEEDFQGLKKIRLIEHFDDVRFGLDTDGEVVIFNFLPTDALPDPVIRPDKTHRSAVARVKLMIEQKQALVDAPVRLTQGAAIQPVLTDPHAIEMRRRQASFTI